MTRYESAKELYAKFGIDTEDALKKLGDITVSVHCWQGDDVSGFENLTFLEHLEMYTDDMSKSNTYETPDAIVPVVNTSAEFVNGKLNSVVQPISWNVFRFKVQ